MLTPSPRSERKIDKIETRLGSIESLLQKLLTTQHAEACSSLSACSACHPKHNLTTQTVSSGAPTASSTAEQEYSGGGDDDDRDDDEGSVLGGDSGLTEQTAFVSEFLERAVQKTSLRELDPRMRMALANLKQLAEMQKKRSISHGPRFPLQRSVPPGGMSTLPMPPLETVVTLLRQTRGRSGGPPESPPMPKPRSETAAQPPCVLFPWLMPVLTRRSAELVHPHDHSLRH